MNGEAAGTTPSRRKAFLLRWRIGAASWYGAMFGPGILGEFRRLRVTLRVGMVVGTATAALAVLAGYADAWVIPAGTLIAGPMLAAIVVAFGVGALTFGDAVRTTWINPPERRIHRLAKRVEHLEAHLQTSPVDISSIPVRDALMGETHDAIMHAEILHHSLPGRGISVVDLSKRMARIADEEHERVLRHVTSPAALVEAERIVDVPAGPALVCVFERRGVNRAADAYALALRVLLRRYAISPSADGSPVLLVEAPGGFTERLALDGWLPRGHAVGPVDESERETMTVLWDEGSSSVYTDAMELLEAARRL